MLFDIIWHFITSFDKFYCFFLFIFVIVCRMFWYRTGEGRMSNTVATCRKGRVVSYFDLIRQNSPAQLSSPARQIFFKLADTLKGRLTISPSILTIIFLFSLFPSIYSSSPILSSNIAVPKTLTNKAKTILTIPIPPSF